MVHCRVSRWQDDADRVWDRFTFTHPVELADVVTVRDALLAVLPAGARVEVYHRHRDVVATATVGVELIKRMKEAA
jgi:hypothetical protein